MFDKMTNVLNELNAREKSGELTLKKVCVDPYWKFYDSVWVNADNKIVYIHAYEDGELYALTTSLEFDYTPLCDEVIGYVVQYDPETGRKIKVIYENDDEYNYRYDSEYAYMEFNGVNHQYKIQGKGTKSKCQIPKIYIKGVEK